LSKAGERIAEEIGEKGTIAFARFMELALYCPNCGYYEAEEDMIGGRGDYYTSVSVGSLFGELLGWQFADWFDQNEPASPGHRDPNPRTRGIRVVEAGAHCGRLARDILTWMLQYRPALFERLQYWVVEPSARRRAWQRQNLTAFGDKVRWAENLGELRGVADSQRCFPDVGAVRGIIFSNELLDAMPVHRLSWDAKERAWFEWGVTLQAGRFVWTRIAGKGQGEKGPNPKSAVSISQLRLPLGTEVLETLPEGFSIELCPTAEEWWREAANTLERGKLLAIDYGLTADEFLMPERKEGTLRAYRHHALSSDVLLYPGEQDITAHVNFTAIQAAGESAGLKTDGLLTQAQFLTSIAARIWQPEGCFGEWTPGRTRQFQTLTHPEHLGRSFRVLVQSRM
jgi:SAM-dependent MidA family methyltransferase